MGRRCVGIREMRVWGGGCRDTREEGMGRRGVGIRERRVWGGGV